MLLFWTNMSGSDLYLRPFIVLHSQIKVTFSAGQTKTGSVLPVSVFSNRHMGASQAHRTYCRSRITRKNVFLNQQTLKNKFFIFICFSALDARRSNSHLISMMWENFRVTLFCILHLFDVFSFQSNAVFLFFTVWFPYSLFFFSRQGFISRLKTGSVWDR